STEVTANGIITTELGDAQVEGRLFDLQQKGKESYKGQVGFFDFDIGEFLDNPDFGETTFGFAVEGKGFDRENLDTHVDGLFNKIVLGEYTYENILVKGDFKYPVFSGHAEGFDPNLRI